MDASWPTMGLEKVAIPWTVTPVAELLMSVVPAALATVSPPVMVVPVVDETTTVLAAAPTPEESVRSVVSLPPEIGKKAWMALASTLSPFTAVVAESLVQSSEPLAV